jgi:hypothetical protein
MHAAEGEMFRAALAAAARQAGIAVVRVPAKDLAGEAERALHLGHDDLLAGLATLGAAAGRPWRQEEKDAALAAWLALAAQSRP